MVDLKFLSGRFITFEGGEGTGKTSLSNQLVECFNKQNIPVIKTFDPGGCESAKKIREIILSNKTELCSNAEMLMFSAARAQLEHDVITPALKDGITVISDRWFDSTVVYQGMCKNHDASIINTIFNYSCNSRPFMTFLLNVDAKLGLKRSYKVLEEDNVDESKFEDLGLEFHKKVNQYFLNLAFDNYYEPDTPLSRWKIIDSNKDLDHCYNEMLEHIRRTIKYFTRG